MKKRNLQVLFLLAIFPFCLNAQTDIQNFNIVRIKMERQSADYLTQRILEKGEFRASSPQYVQTGITALDGMFKKTKTIQMKRLIPYNKKFDARHRAKGLDQWFEIVIEENVENSIEELNKLEEVIIAETIDEITLSGLTEEDPPVDDQYLRWQWYLNNTGTLPNGSKGGLAGTDINVFPAWKITMGKPNVVVAILDSGVEINHIDLKDNLWINEKELNGEEGIDDDDNGYIDDIHGADFVYNRSEFDVAAHGTHISGIIAAKSNNFYGIAGIAGGKNEEDGVRLMICQVFNSEYKAGSFPPAFVYAADNGAVIAQCSWNSGTTPKQANLEAIEYFIEYAGRDENGNPLPNTPMVGGLPVFAAGNNGVSTPYYPPAHDICIAVAAIDMDNKKADYSNYGNWVNISAPGGSLVSSGEDYYGQIFSTFPIGYDMLKGTSQACPIVSGVAALILSHYGNENYTVDMLKKRLLGTVSSVNGQDTQFEGRLGVGMVDAYAALATNFVDIDSSVDYGKIEIDEDNISSPPGYHETFRVYNSTGNEMILSEIILSTDELEITNFKPGISLASGEAFEFKLKFTPSEIKEYNEFITIRYGGELLGESSLTQVFARVEEKENSIPLIKTGNSVLVYPIPARTQLTVETNEIIETLEILDISGRRVYYISPVNKKSIELEVLDYPSGIYFIKIKTDGGQYTEKIVLE